MPPTMHETFRNNYNILADFLKKVSYKPGWSISITEEPSNHEFLVHVVYEAYESDNAAVIPINYDLSTQRERASQVAARLTGKTFRKPERRCFTKNFSMFSIDQMAPKDVLRYFVAETIKEAEMFEFERWLKVDGDRMFSDE